MTVVQVDLADACDEVYKTLGVACPAITKPSGHGWGTPPWYLPLRNPTAPGAPLPTRCWLGFEDEAFLLRVTENCKSRGG